MQQTLRALLETALALTEGTPERDGRQADITHQLVMVVSSSLIQSGDLEQAHALLMNAVGTADYAPADLALVDRLLDLAKGWERHGDATLAGHQAETALRRAVELAPERAMPVLARFLQRQGRAAEAIRSWQEATRLNPQESNHYLTLARLLTRAGAPEQALSVYEALIEAVPSAKSYLIVADRLDELAAALPEARPQQRIRIALVGNATLDHLKSYVKVECFRAGLRPTFYLGGFDQYTQEILNQESDLYRFNPDVLICAIHASRLFPELHRYPFELGVDQRRNAIDAGLATLRDLLDTFVQRSSALVLIHNMVAPQHPAIGIADLRDEFGQAAIFSEINMRLAELIRVRFHNVFVVDEQRVQARIGTADATDPRLWLTARIGWSDAASAALAREYLRYLIPYRGLSRKCIVLDLDNTLWGGVIGEDGLGGIQLGSDAPGNAFVALQEELLRLWRRGILLAIVSKNNQEDALAAFDSHPSMVLKLSHFSAYRINWNPKADNIRAIAQELNIGLDSMVFLDDNPVERAAVRAELPHVMTPELPTDPAYYRAALLDLSVFDSLALTQEDLTRNKLYADQRARQAFEQKHQSNGSLTDFLVDLQMVVKIAPLNDVTLARVAQLTGKTNQFNLTTRRYSEAQLLNLMAQKWEIFTASVSDRFGDNGIVSVAIVRPVAATTWEIDTLLLSCRVMGRGVETAMLASIAGLARSNGRLWLQGWYLPTPKNAPARDCYREHGFTLVTEESDGALWQLDLQGTSLETPHWLRVEATEARIARSHPVGA